MPFFKRLKQNSIFECSDDVHVWYQMKAYMCANVKAKHTWKQNIQTYKNHVFLEPDVHLHWEHALSLLWKVLEKVMYEQLYDYLNNYLNDLLCGFCKAHSTQHILSWLIRSLEKGLDNSGLVGTIFIDRWKAYDCLPLDLLIAKLEAYSLDKPSLNLVNGYLR